MRIDPEWAAPLRWGDPLPPGKEGLRANVSGIPVDNGCCASLLFQRGQWTYPHIDAKCYSIPGTPVCQALQQYRDEVNAKVEEWLHKVQASTIE
jgi:hypothetical protein